MLVRPSAAASLDEAHAAIDLWEHYSHKRLDPEQKLAIELMMATRADGTWAARTTGRPAARQNGKGDELEVVESWDLIHRGAPVMHTAHEFKTAKKAHMRLVGFLYAHRDLRKKVRAVRSNAVSLSVETYNDGIVSYSTRTAGGGRGLDDIARLVVDEAQWAQSEQLASSTPILAVNPNPQMNFTGSAGVAGRSEWWWSLRKRALEAGRSADGFSWLEHSAERISLRNGRVVSDRPDSYDRTAWKRANFAYPARIPDDYLAEQLRLLGAELFAREHLNVWDPSDVDNADSPLDPVAFAACMVDRREPVAAIPAFLIDASWGLRSSALGIAAADDAGLFVDCEHGPGTEWLLVRAAEFNKHYPDAHWFHEATGPAGVLRPAFAALGIELEPFTGPDMGRACANLQQLVLDKAIQICADDALTAALAGAVKRDVGDGLWAWGRRKSSTDISPLIAITGAAWAWVSAMSDRSEPWLAWR